MAYYDYHCEANQQTVEVEHSVNDKLHTWKELCECAEIELGDTPPDAPVSRVVGGVSLGGSKSTNAFTPAQTRKDSGHVCGPNCSH